MNSDYVPNTGLGAGLSDRDRHGPHPDEALSPAWFLLTLCAPLSAPLTVVTAIIVIAFMSSLLFKRPIKQCDLLISVCLGLSWL